MKSFSPHEFDEVEIAKPTDSVKCSGFALLDVVYTKLRLKKSDANETEFNV